MSIGKLKNAGTDRQVNPIAGRQAGNMLLCVVILLSSYFPLDRA